MKSTITRIIVDKNIIKLPLIAKQADNLPLLKEEIPIPRDNKTTPKNNAVITTFSAMSSLLPSV